MAHGSGEKYSEVCNRSTSAFIPALGLGMPSHPHKAFLFAANDILSLNGLSSISPYVNWWYTSSKRWYLTLSNQNSLS